jgi:oxygen-independent coproporphyrinogen-3 oxidase
MLSLYLHIPFCRQRCLYCDFFLVTRSDYVERFFKALAEETRAKAELLQGRKIKAIHFGGGTPSFVPLSFLSEWLAQISGITSLCLDAEITLEANPEDLDQRAITALGAAGVNRLSIGVQSFIDSKLRSLGRAHSSDDAVHTVSMAMERFSSVSIDLICGAEGETAAEWEADLKAALRLRPQHISVYMLTLEERTRLWRDVRKGSVRLPDEDEQASMYDRARRMIGDAGYGHYEVSNYALPGYHSRYNLASWMREPYLGFGPSAHSFMVSEDVETRFSNACSLLRYLADPAGAMDFREVLTPAQRFDEEVFLSLRINRGLPVEFLRKGHKLGLERLDAVIREFREKGWISIDDGIVTLTGRGFLFADLIAGELLSD